jgi:hypothetical protein
MIRRGKVLYVIKNIDRQGLNWSIFPLLGGAARRERDAPNGKTLALTYRFSPDIRFCVVSGSIGPGVL